MRMNDRLLRRREVEEFTGLSRASIYRLMRQWKIPSTCQGQRDSRQVEDKRHHRLDRVPAGSNERTRFDDCRMGIAWLIRRH